MNRNVLWIGSVVLAATIGFGVANFANSQTGEKPKRFPQLTMDQLNDQQRPLGEKIMMISSVGLGGPYNPLLRNATHIKSHLSVCWLPNRPSCKPGVSFFQ